MILRSAIELAEAVALLDGFKDSSKQLIDAPRARGRGRPARPRRGRRPVPLRAGPDLDHPLEGHLRAARGCCRRLRERGRRARGDPRQEPLSGAEARAPRHRRRRRARLRLHERLPRHGERGRDLGLDAGAVAAARRPDRLRRQPRRRLRHDRGRQASSARGSSTRTWRRRQVIFAALLGAIAWNLVTWWLGLPSSSSHALIGGLIGAAIAKSGVDGVEWHGVAAQRPHPGAGRAADRLRRRVLAAAGASSGSSSGPRPGPPTAASASGSSRSGTFVAFTHGANDAQKTMGVIALALFSYGSIRPLLHPDWVKVSAGLAIAAGTYVGGWRIMRTLGQRLYKMEPPARLRGPELRRGDDLPSHALRLSALDDARDLRRRPRLGRDDSASRRCAGASPATSSPPGC